MRISQSLRKDCVPLKKGLHDYENRILPDSTPSIQPFIEVTKSGMINSWGTFFSSQPRHHRWHLKPYPYLISRAFMTVAHFVLPWKDLMIRSGEDVEREVKNG